MIIIEEYMSALSYMMKVRKAGEAKLLTTSCRNA